MTAIAGWVAVGLLIAAAVIATCEVVRAVAETVAARRTKPWWEANTVCACRCHIDGGYTPWNTCCHHAPPH